MDGEYRKVFFPPWKGDNYERGISNKRVLILGESVYCLPPEKCACEFAKNNTCSYTIDLIDGRVNKKKRNSYFTKVTKLLTGKGYGNISEIEDFEFWHSVAFYEYIQKSVGTEARQRPSNEMWNFATDPFLEILDKLKPNFILITGKELSDNLHRFQGNWDNSSIEIKEGKDFAKYGKFRHNDLVIDVVSTYHPSAPGKFNYNVMDFVLGKLNTNKN